MDAHALVAHACAQISATPPGQSPFPHLVVDNLLPEDVLAEIHRLWPTEEQFQTLTDLGRVSLNKYEARRVISMKSIQARMDSMRATFWLAIKSFMFSQEFNMAIINQLKDARDARVKRDGLQKKAYGPDSLIVEDQDGYFIPPHTDHPKRLLTVLIYLPQDDSTAEYGTSLYRPKIDMSNMDPCGHYKFHVFDKITTVDYIPNRLVAFIRDFNTYHGVEPMVAPPRPRRLLIHQLEEKQESKA